MDGTMMMMICRICEGVSKQNIGCENQYNDESEVKIDELMVLLVDSGFEGRYPDILHMAIHDVMSVCL